MGQAEIRQIDYKRIWEVFLGKTKYRTKVESFAENLHLDPLDIAVNHKRCLCEAVSRLKAFTELLRDTYLRSCVS